MSKNKGSFLFIEFAEAPRPIFIERAGKNEYVRYGEENDYPEYLLSLFNNSSKHGAIVSGKATYIAGKSLEGNSKLIKKANRYGETLHQVLRKCTLDLEIFAGFYLEVIESNGSEVAELVHVPYQKVRLDKDMKKAWIKDNWKTGLKEQPARNINTWQPGKGKGLFIYREYRPGIDIYTVPQYIPALNWIAADVEISRHVLQNAQAGFMPSKLVNLNDGEPTEEEKSEIEKAFNDKFTGHNGKKLIISFNATPEVAPTVQDLGVSDMTKEDFSRIDSLVEQNIFSGHRITSPMIFGIKTAGQLGGRTELREAWELLQNNYVELKQESLEEALEPLVGQFEIVELEPIGFESSDAVMTAALAAAPKRWLLEKLGIKETDYPEAFTPPPADQADKTEDEPAPGKKEQMAAQDWGIFQKFGLPRADFSVIKNKKVKFSSQVQAVEDELEILTSQEFLKMQFAVTTLEGRILELLKSDPLMTPQDIADSLDTKKALVQNSLDKMEKDGTITRRMVKDQDGAPLVSYDITDGITPDVTRPSAVEVGVRYSYEVKAEFREPNEEDPTGAIIPTSRPFCMELIKADRFYTRKDIEAMSSEMGYSVWDQKGGWMGIRGTDEKEPECRHTWVSNVVVRKQK